MKCNKCGKDINEFEQYCDNCKSISLKEEEFNKLIEENKSLNELENTKELKNLDKLVQENSNESLKEDLKNIVKIDDLEIQIDSKTKKRNIIIIVSIIILMLIVTVTVFLFVIPNKEEPEKQEVVIDYQKVINEYGDSINITVSKYLKANKEIPSWSIVNQLVNYKEYEIVCDIHNIYKDGNIYLNECSVDGKKVEYSYGLEQQEVIGKSINIYIIDHGNNYFTYSDEEEGTLKGNIICKTEECEFISAYEKYVLIKEEKKYYIYDYVNNSLEFGPFNIIDNNYENNILSHENILYGILYEEDGVKKIYNISLGKNFKTIEGNLMTYTLDLIPTIMYKYGYVVFKVGDKNNFVNLKTGNVSYTIDGTLSSFIEDTNKDLVYITKYNSNNSKITIYNSNGKKMFDGKEFNEMCLSDKDIVLSNDNNYYIYDSNLKLKLTSKKYDRILKLYKDFIVVVDNEYLEIVDLSDEILATFDLKWDNDVYFFHSMLSGWYTENGKNGIYLVVENKSIPYGTIGSGLEYYYIPSTNEVGVIEIEGVGGYAKPVLYLYPEEKTEVTVTFSNPNLLTTTYPKYKNKWQVIVYPNGDLYDSNNKYYYGLYWEEDLSHFVDFSEGFYVETEDAIEFLEEKLQIIGLNDRERNEFIMYWLPIIEKNKKNLIYFELTEERDSYNKLLINPKPDSVLRMAIHVKKVNKKTSIKKQKLSSFERNGFVAVEWGGVIYR